ncbi:sel1 repeat family protein [Lysobacter sp. TY2-98]|uniref:tetratricopeptide repeat protein n=1 Tax=Lysobacter sp. TY2-98 TaxID=2290922 RepID=UPI000E20865F|nr:SEL1-like repeat protein [Lysobacter sp. TY2-98]AXK72471.1 sel1 repeat family protein [Lysobacter sp. TY2-98]
MMRTRLLALALGLAVAPAVALADDAPSPAVEALVKAKVEAAQAAAGEGHYDQAFELLGEATQAAHSGAMAHKLGHLYEGTPSIANHDAMALKWFQYAADLKDPESMYHVGMHYLAGSGGLPQDDRKALALLEASADGGYHPARSEVSAWYDKEDEKSRCLLSTVRGYRMASVVFGSLRFYDFTDSGDDGAGGDTYEVVGGKGDYGTKGGRAALEVDGFSHVGYTESNGSRFYHDYYDARRPSSAALARAAEIRAKCGVAER